jgi:hypothetical protein
VLSIEQSKKPPVRCLLNLSTQHSSLSTVSKKERGQVILGHTELTAYRCFLPDLAGFTGFCRTGPSPFPQLVLSAEL